MSKEASNDKILVWQTNALKTDHPKVYDVGLSSYVRFKNGYEGRPKAIENCSSESLERKGIVGIYKCEADPKFKLVLLASNRFGQRRRLCPSTTVEFEVPIAGGPRHLSS